MFAGESSAVDYVLAAIDLVVCLVASGHVLLFKRDTRAASGWIGLIWLSPILGASLYLLLGINRIHRRARSLRRSRAHHAAPSAGPVRGGIPRTTLEPGGDDMATLSHLVGQIAGSPLVAGNELEPLVGGDEAYPAMIRAIDGATRSIALGTYIFDDDRAGRPFIDALARAVGRGVEVRVLIDDLGSRHRWPSAVGPLRDAGVPVARFLPTLAPGWFPYLNLRNHRKILVVDGHVGFTGGMNILKDYLLGVGPRRPKRDLHFRVLGPAVAGLRRVFAEDWEVATGEDLRDDRWAPPVAEAGGMLARVVVDGPDDDRDTLLKVLLGALACARSSVAIATPYFLPDARLIAALETAALRGVQVDIVLPSRNNHLLVQWASTAAVREVLEGRCRVWASPPPFDHTKLMIVDRAWSFVGSANWDPRSLRLNFELNLECYGGELAGRLDGFFRERLRGSVPVTVGRIDARGLACRLRDGAARLLSPYL
jgi:cardiolipin synthase